MLVFRRSFLCLWLLSFSACAFGGKIEYRGASDFRTSIKPTSLIVAVQDQRPYVLSGNKSVQFVGLRRALFGIPYGVHTRSRNALADDMGSLITTTLQHNNASVQQVTLTPHENINSLISTVKASSAEYALFFVLREWKTDQYFGTSLSYDVHLSVFDKAGNKKAEAEKRGRERIGSRYTLANATSKIFGDLLNSPEVTAVIGSR